LMSGGVLFEMGFDIHLTKKHGHQLIRHNDDNTQTILPFEYNSEARTWIARVLVSRQSGQAQKLCRRILARIERGQEWKFFKGRFLTPTIKAQIVRWARTVSVTRAVEVVQRVQTRAQAMLEEGSLGDVDIEIEPLEDAVASVVSVEDEKGASVPEPSKNERVKYQEMVFDTGSVPEPSQNESVLDASGGDRGQESDHDASGGGHGQESVLDASSGGNLESLVDRLSLDMDTDLTAVKPFMHPRLKVATLHRRWCHVGCNKLGKCMTCEQLH
jgi:hypothetical protein